MFFKKGLLCLILAVTLQNIVGSPPPPTKEPSKLLVKKVGQPIVYTADRSREEPPQPRGGGRPTYASPTIGTTLDELYNDETKLTSNVPENTGFVDPIDFKSFLSGVGNGAKKSDYLPSFGSESKQKDTFAGFFNTKDGNDFPEASFSGLSSASSNQNSRKPDQEDEAGFVDPNVQFRSLFDSSETAHGFKPEDFLGSKDDSSGVEPSKGSQTQAFPSFTYTGRNGQERQEREEDPEQQQNRFRSSYRQVDSRGGNRGQQQQAFDPYDDSNYYGGEYDDSPASPPNPRRQQYNNNNRYSQRQGVPEQEGDDDSGRQNYAPAVQESTHTPQASGPKAAESSSKGKGRCKKIQKEVEYADDYAQAYTDPEPDYDPSSYGGNSGNNNNNRDRYKRQARGRNDKKNTRPMTCYVCEDEAGRYAERCEYDSKGDPKSGNYFHSSSSSFNDNGRRPRGGRGSGSERYRRNPSLATKQVSTTTLPSVSTAQSVSVPQTTETSDRDKRQSNSDNNNRGRINFGGGGGGAGRGGGGGGREDDYGEDGGRDYDNSSERNGESDYYDGDDSEEDRGGLRGDSTTVRGNNRDRDEYDVGSPTTAGARRNENRQNEENYGFAPPPRNRGGGGNREFDFGPPSDFGRDASSSGSNNNNNRGFREFDFSIPREFDPDVQLGTSNTNQRPVFSGTNNNDEFGLGNFDTGYDDYVKKYFGGSFGNADGGSTPGPSPASSSFRPGPSSSSPSPPRGHSPHKEHTQQSHNYAPAPYDFPYENTHNLEKLMGAFSNKDRSGCQKVQKGDMTCYVCRDARGMNKEECMYASNDPNGKNTRMAYHESTEYSSPPVMVVPFPRPRNPLAATASSTPKSAETTTTIHKKSESKIVEKKAKKSPVDYDFDY